jgi:hypothetical protein
MRQWRGNINNIQVWWQNKTNVIHTIVSRLKCDLTCEWVKRCTSANRVPHQRWLTHFDDFLWKCGVWHYSLASHTSLICWKSIPLFPNNSCVEASGTHVCTDNQTIFRKQRLNRRNIARIFELRLLGIQWHHYRFTVKQQIETENVYIFLQS